MPESPFATRPATPRPPGAEGLTPPSPALPLAGLTLLAVEDSRFACEALRLMAQRSGARLRRAATLEEGRRHLRVYRPDVLLLDPGLPDGCGFALLAELAAARPAAPPVIVSSGLPEHEARARASGAAGWIAKPVADLAAFRRAVTACLPDRAWLVTAGEGGATPLPPPDPLALRDDLAAAALRLAQGPDDREGRYLAGFIAGLARAAGDAGLAAAAQAAARPGPGTLADLAAAVARRLRHRPPGASALG
jgi:CheY-like chemotaxis protein